MVHVFGPERQPDLLILHERWPERYPFFLESVARRGRTGRYDLLLACPGAFVSQSGPRTESWGDWRLQHGEDFFNAIDRWSTEEGRIPSVGELPFCGGWFLLLGYELAAVAEPTLQLPASPYQLPDGLAVRCHAALLRDHRTNTTTLVSENPALLPELLGDAHASAVRFPPCLSSLPSAGGAVESEPKQFLRAVEQALEYLKAGDIFQVNLSRAWYGKLPYETDIIHRIYRLLRRSNPAPFASSIRWHGSALLSSSPERLLLIENGIAETRPIAGTHARDGDAARDATQRILLLSSLKERAEHLMLVDLERNDLGRICQTGSIDVDELMVLESYAHVHHIVSNVRGQLCVNVGPGTALRAVFPGGTITGCPKVRAMQVIAELEKEARGPYTGAVGYLSRCGRLDTNILIRSVLCEGGRYVLRAGAGIVADSSPEAELDETRAKARGLLLALGAADVR